MRITKDFFYSVIILILVVIILLQRACSTGGSSVSEKPKTRTEYVVTYYKEIDSPVKYVPTPYKIEVPGETVYLPVDSSGKVDTPAIINKYVQVSKDYYSKVTYKDTISHKYGKITIEDTVSQNRIISRKPVFEFDIPVTTITNYVPEKKKTKWFIGPEIYGSSEGVISHFGAGLNIVNKKDQLYGISALASPNQPLYYGFTFKFKIGKK